MRKGAGERKRIGPAHGFRLRRERLALTLSVLALLLVAASISIRLIAGTRLQWIPVLGVALAAGLLLVELLLRLRSSAAFPEKPLKDLLDSAGPIVLGVGPDARFTYVNPAAERMLGYQASEFQAMEHAGLLLAPGQAERLVNEMFKLRAGPKPLLNSDAERLAAYMEGIASLPPSQIPSFELLLRRKNGSLVPAALQVSALRNKSGEFDGVVAVAIDRSAVVKQEQALRESQERYRDLFENSSDMIATLDAAGQFLYANPAWKRCFETDSVSLSALGSLELLFGENCRADILGLFRRALDGESIDRVPVRNHSADGRIREFEISLSQRQRAGTPLAVRCLLRDVTQQKQRENRLALQLVVNRIVGENASPEVAAMRILEAVCASQSWDVAVKWDVNAEENRLEFSTAWGSAGPEPAALIQESMGFTMRAGDDLPGQAWRHERPVWLQDLANVFPAPRIQAALRHHMRAGWAVPVRVGSTVLAVLEFYCHFNLRENRDALAATEMAATSLGQMLARSRASGQAEELYRQREILLDSVADSILGVDYRGLVGFANPAAARMLKASAAALIGKPVHELLHGAARETQRCNDDCPLRRAAKAPAPLSGEDSLYLPGGNAIPIEYSLTPTFEQKRLSGSVLSFRDISQRYALDRMKDEFISTVSHELRTPLTSIRGALGLLSSGTMGELSDKAANLMRIALSNSDRLVRLINDILDLERIQSGREPLAYRTVRLGELVVQAIEGMQPVADAAGVQLIHDATHVEIAADPDRLLQVLTNLLSNAVKFSPANSTISVMLRPGAKGVLLSVIDHGRGIPAEKLESIFGRFQQVDAGDSRQKGGSGLGLAICRTIVQQHSGRIWAEQNPVCGSTFRVFLPYRPAEKQELEPVQSEAEVR